MLIVPYPVFKPNDKKEKTGEKCHGKHPKMNGEKNRQIPEFGIFTPDIGLYDLKIPLFLVKGPDSFHQLV